jgi:uracil-DNA glycosylase
MQPSLSSAGGTGVALIGEALGKDEVDAGEPFVGMAGFKLTRLLEWAGYRRDAFDIFNTVWCRPPGNQLEGTEYEYPAVEWCQTRHWGELLKRTRVLVPMGNVPTRALLNVKRILTTRGYIYPRGLHHVVPTIHPSFIQRGNAKWSAAFINDIQKAVEVARDGYTPDETAYLLDPTPVVALRWAESYVAAYRDDPSIRVAFDIETPGKGEDEEDVDLGDDVPDRTWNIERISFAYRPFRALSIPWDPAYLAVIRLLLAGPGDKVVWNAGFDVPRIRRAGVDIAGVIHDGMVAWHILHTDLPKRLGFVATFTCPRQPAWKHLSSAQPAFYNATDSDVELRSMIAIEAELRKNDLWDVYQKDVLDLEPLLIHMHTVGMPVDAAIRQDRAEKLASELARVREAFTECVPLAARKIAHVYKIEPRNKQGLDHRRVIGQVKVCSVCGTVKPLKPHFKRYVKKHNPCADGVVQVVAQEVDEYYRLAPFTPSRDQLMRYHQHKRRANPTTWDAKTRTRKVSFGDRQLKELVRKFPKDPLYGFILQYRELDKLAGTYIGRPIEEQRL